MTEMASQAVSARPALSEQFVSVEEAYSRIGDALYSGDPIKRTQRKEIPLADVSLGDILSDDAYAKSDVPHRPLALRSGYAVQFSSAKEHGDGLMFANWMWVGTGGFLFQPSDTVIPVEKTLVTDGALTTSCRDVKSGQFVLKAGSAESEGCVLLRSGSSLNPGNVALLRSAGVERVCINSLLPFSCGILYRAAEEDGHGLFHVARASMWLSEFSIKSKAYSFRLNSGSIEFVENDAITLEEIISRHDTLIVLGSCGLGELCTPMWSSLIGLPGWIEVIRGVRFGPGKGLTVGIVHKGEAHRVPVFCLAGLPRGAEGGFFVFALPFIRSLQQNERFRSFPFQDPRRSIEIYPLQIRMARAQQEVVRSSEIMRVLWVNVSRSTGCEFPEFSCRFDDSEIETCSRADGFVCVSPGRDRIQRGDAVPVVLWTKVQWD